MGPGRGSSKLPRWVCWHFAAEGMMGMFTMLLSCALRYGVGRTPVSARIARDVMDDVGNMLPCLCIPSSELG